MTHSSAAHVARWCECSKPRYVSHTNHPFVNEELWQKFVARRQRTAEQQTSIMIQPYPKSQPRRLMPIGHSGRPAETYRRFLRNLRSEMNCLCKDSTARGLGDAQIFTVLSPYVQWLARLSAVEMVPA